tara:strand:+ start:1821 stop:2189 length:369 start_codon:yes stop_codon:yes gene_type:complete
MELKQKYIEGNFFEVDEWFIERLQKYPPKAGIDVARQLEINFDDLEELSGWTQRVGGVCTTLEEPIYFEIEYLKQPDEPPLFLDISAIEVDDYLDYILENKTLKLNNDEKKSSRPICSRQSR